MEEFVVVHDTADAQTEVERAEHEWMDAAFRHDLAACERYLAEEFTMVTSRGGLIDRETWLVYVRDHARATEPAQFPDLRVRVYGDAALVTSRSLMAGATFRGQAWSPENYITDVWVRRDGRWQVVRRHSSPVVPDVD
jgi:ketosteroid isomerase-like protein